MYDSKMKNPETDALYEAILSLKDLESCYRFFDDLCTYKEIEAMTQRLTVAKMLAEGKTFSVIAEKTGVSTATITRVHRAMNYGAGGYANVLEKK